MNEKFTIDDMIEFCNSELPYHQKKADLYRERFAGKKPDSPNAYLLGMHNGFNVAYQNILESLMKLKEMQNERYDETTNEGDLAYCDDFLCSKCGIHLTDWFRMDVKEEDRYEYEFKFCPNCSAKIVNHD